MKVMFSVLGYYPSFITNESINVAILFHNIDDDTRKFEITTNWTRVRHFDDEVDVEFLKELLNGIKNEVNNDNMFNYKEKFNMRKYVKFYVNELKFSEIAFVNVENLDKFICETKKIFLRYDFEKKERPTHTQQLNYIKSLLKDNNVQYSSKNVKGNHRENINFDYIIDGYAFKLFTFEDKRLSKIIFSAKSWAYTANEMKDKYKIIFIYDTEINNEEYNSIIEILKSSACQIMKMDEAIEFIINVKSKSQTFIQQQISI